MISIKKVKKIHLILSLFLLLWANNGVFSYINLNIPIYVKFFVFAICIVLETMIDKQNLTVLIKKALPLIIMSFIASILYAFNNNVYLMIASRAFFYLLIIFSQLLFYIKEDEKTKKIIIYTIMIDYLFLGINTLIQLIENPYLSRILSTADAEYTFNTGNYSFIYSTIFFILYFLNNILDKKNIIISVLFVFFLSNLLILGNFTISYIILLISLVLFIILKLHSKKRIISLMLVISIIALSFNFVIPKVLDKIYYSDGASYEVKARVKEMKMAWDGENIDGTDMSSRLRRYKSSFDAFFDNILIGTSNYEKIGGHSSWLDLVGLFGLCSFFFFFFQYKTFKFLINRIPKSSHPVFIAIIIVYLIQGLINTVMFFNTFLYLLLIIPLLIEVGTSRKNNL